MDRTECVVLVAAIRKPRDKLLIMGSPSLSSKITATDVVGNCNQCSVIFNNLSGI